MSKNAKDLTDICAQRAERSPAPQQNPSRYPAAHPQPPNQRVAFETWDAGLE